MDDSKKDISIYINSPGGSVTAGLAIYDTMQFLTCDVNTYCIGMAASMGAVLLVRWNERQALRAAEHRHHDPSGLRRRARPGQRRGAPGRIHVQAEEAPHRDHSPTTPARSRRQVKKDCDRDYFMTADEAKGYGLVDEVVQSRKEMKAFRIRPGMKWNAPRA